MSDGDLSTGGPDGTDGARELARLRSERDRALAELEHLRARRPSRRRLRRIVAVTLVVASCVSFLGGGVGIWAGRNFLDTDVWVQRVGPLAEDPAVQRAIGSRVTDEVMRLVDPRALFEDVLPERGRLLAVPLAGAVEGFVGDQVDAVVASDGFARLWVQLNRRAHAAAVRVLRDESDVVTAGDRSVTLNLLPLVDRVLQRLEARTPELLGRPVPLPRLGVDDPPAAAVRVLGQRLGVDLPRDFAQVEVYDAGRLRQLQDAVALFDRLVWFMVVACVACAVGALAVSVDRRRTLLQLAVADVLLLALLRRAAARTEVQLLDLVRGTEEQRAVRSVVRALFEGLFDGTRVLLWLLGIVIVVAAVTGSGPRATALRRRAVAAIRAVGSAARDHGPDPATGAWLVAHRDVLQVGVVAVGAVLLWWWDLSWTGVLVLLVAVGAAVALLARLRPPDGESDDVVAGAGGAGADDDRIRGAGAGPEA